MAYSRDVVSNDFEKDILTGMIISTPYLREVSDMINPKYFKIDYCRKVAQWVLQYYKRYKIAPFKDIQSIFAVESQKLKEPEAEIIELFLRTLSDDYQEDTPFNKDYWIDKTILFCKDRALEILQQTIEGYRLQGDIDKAEEAVIKFNKTSQEMSRWVDPFTNDEIDATFEEDESDKLFRLPGALGELIGDLKRGWLVSFLGPTKRGKSFYAWETVYHALTAKLKVAIFSFEMNKTTNKKRIYKRLTAMADEGGEYAYPVFDCLSNQDDSCKKIERINKIRLLLSSGEKPKFADDLVYRPCDYCRRDPTEQKNYLSGTWWALQTQKEDLSPEIIKKKRDGFKKIYGSRLRLIAPPSFSVGFDFINASLDRLEYAEGFVADVVLIDSLDITEPEVKDELQDQNIKSMRAKRLAGERHCLVINCDQGNRDSTERANIKQKHTQGTIKRLQNVDAEFTLNQTEEEKKQGIMRIEILIHRHDESTEKGQVFVLQQLKLGQPFLDSEWADNQIFRKGRK